MNRRFKPTFERPFGNTLSYRGHVEHNQNIEDKDFGYHVEYLTPEEIALKYSDVKSEDNTKEGT